jgi:AraC-like DNA-binding protein
MLSARTIFRRDGLEIADVACRHGRGRGTSELAAKHSVGFVRRGCFVRSAGGAEALLDPSTVFFVNPGEEQRYDHPHSGGDDCTILLLASALECSDAPRTQAGRPGTGHALRRLVDEAREALAADPSQSLPVLARRLSVSPHHLSRLFSAATGHTISRHRMRLRARAALERLAGGERNLARLAADLDLADQSHLSRVVRSETGSTPSSLREALRQ